jgi:hypothetical protein
MSVCCGECLYCTARSATGYAAVLIGLTVRMLFGKCLCCGECLCSTARSAIGYAAVLLGLTVRMLFGKGLGVGGECLCITARSAIPIMFNSYGMIFCKCLCVVEHCPEFYRSPFSIPIRVNSYRMLFCKCLCVVVSVCAIGAHSPDIK